MTASRASSSGAAFALIVGDAVVALWQGGDYFMRRYFQARAGAATGVKAPLPG
jgi:hypothetical protein